MPSMLWFDDAPLGQLPAADAAFKLRAVGDEATAQQLEASLEPETVAYRALKLDWPFHDKPWQYRAHAFGYLAPASAGQDLLPICPIEDVQADATLQHARLKISLNRLRVAEYPGRGTHRILLHCAVQNQVAGKTEPAHFNATYRVGEGQQAPLRGYPLFVGLHVGGEGLLLQCRTINVKNEQDHSLLDVLESDVFQAGLQLASVVQPALLPLSTLGLGLAKMLTKRAENVPVQDFALGLDFGNTRLGARLAEGDYLVVQIPESLQRIWTWDEWAYHRVSGQVVKRANPQQPIPYNYLVLGITRYQGA